MLLEKNIFDRIFPFSFVMDPKLEIIQAGKSLRKLFPEIQGKSFGSFFTIERPRHAEYNLQSIIDFSDQLFILKVLDAEESFLFRGEMFYLNQKNLLLFLGSPWIVDADRLKTYHLGLLDFAIHDPITDLLQVLKSKEIATKDIQTLNAQLEKSEERYRELVELGSDIIYKLDHKGHLSYLNEVSLRKIGYTNAEMIHRPFSDFVEPKWAEKIMASLFEAIKEKKVEFYLEFPLITKDQAVIWVGQQNQVIYEGDEFVEVRAFAQEITERKQIEEDLKSTEIRLSNLISNLQAGILVEDETRKIVLTNQMFCDLFHIPAPPDQLLGMDCTDSAQQSKTLFKDPENFVAGIEKCLGEKKINLAMELEMSNGKILERDFIPLISEGQYLGHLWQYRDLTEKKQYELELIRAKKEAEAAQDAEQKFLAKMSHEIRTPLNAIVGMTHLLKNTKIDDEQQEYLDILTSSSNLLKDLVSDILDLSKITSGQIDVLYKEFDLKHLLDNLYQSFLHRLKGKAVDLHFEADPHIPAQLVGDELLVNQILINLLSNATKFTDQGEIKLQVKSMDKKDGFLWLAFNLKDTGIGIAKDQIPQIFHNFVQLSENKTRNYEGTGLGLAIVKQIVDLLGGNIAVESQLNIGSEFKVILPFKETDKESAGPMIPAGLQDFKEIEGLNILVFEDNRMNQLYIRKLLSKWKVEFKMAENGEQGLILLENNDFDLILMDLQMPGMDGYEATRQIRANIDQPNSRIPIIALTASALTDHQNMAIEVGMNDFISKPFTPEQLLDILIRYRPTKKQKTPVPERTDQYALDENYFQTYYDGDHAYASEMIEIFIESHLKDIDELKQCIQQNKWETARQLIHKLKPSFGMVGLSNLEKDFILIGSHLTDQGKRSEAMSSFEDFNKKLENYIPSLHRELEKLKQHSQKTTS